MISPDSTTGYEFSESMENVSRLMESTSIDPKDFLRLDRRICLCTEQVPEKYQRVSMTAPEYWQQDLVTPGQRLAQLYGMEHLSDVKITFPDQDVVYNVS